MEIDILNDVPTTDAEGEKYIVIKISNKAIKQLNSAIRLYKGDIDDRHVQKLLDQVREDILKCFNFLNPS